MISEDWITHMFVNKQLSFCTIDVFVLPSLTILGAIKIWLFLLGKYDVASYKNMTHLKVNYDMYIYI